MTCQCILKNECFAFVATRADNGELIITSRTLSKLVTELKKMGHEPRDVRIDACYDINLGGLVTRQVLPKEYGIYERTRSYWKDRISKYA